MPLARFHTLFPLATLGLLASAAHGQMLGPTPYLCFDDSPFRPILFGYFHLETFEDHLFNVPGVTANTGGVTSVVFGPQVHDSVDCDDGELDGSGLDGDLLCRKQRNHGVCSGVC